MKIKSNVIIVLVLFSTIAFAQNKTMLLNKAGTYKVVNWGIHEGECVYTATEKTDNYNKLIAITNAFKKNPVLEKPLGFDAEAVLYRFSCPDRAKDYGIMNEIELHFCVWSSENGKETKWIIEPPNFGIWVNTLQTAEGGGFNFTCIEPQEKIVGFNYEKWKEATIQLRDLFLMHHKAKDIAPGFTLFENGSLIIYNPDRPPYWVPVTLREAFNRMINYYTLSPTQMDAEVLKYIRMEMGKFSEEELNRPAYEGDPGSISKLGSDKNEHAIMRFNPEYWNKKLPRSSVQIMTIFFSDDNAVNQQKLDEYKQNNDGYYHVQRFINAMDISILKSLIDR